MKTVEDFVFLYTSPEMVQNNIRRLQSNVRKPLNKLFKENDEFYHTTSQTFSRIPMSHLDGHDKLDILAELGVFGVPNAQWATYLSANESISLSHYAQHGTQLDRVYEAIINRKKLSRLRNIFIDPEITSPTEFGLNYIVGGGIPRAALKEIRTLERLDAIVKGEIVN